jgi:LysM repeat protein
VAVFTKLATYTVQAGDSLYTIGLKFGVSWQSIASANNISSPYTIYPGQVLVIPTSLPTPSKIATGNSVYDQFDSYIVTYSQSFGITDPMIVKSMIMQESAFQPNAVSPDIPCGIPIGWTADQSKSFGLMQVTPACVQPNTIPNLTQDTTSSQWATSWFNPSYNINRGVQALSTALSDMKNKFPGCTSNQYTLMAVGAYNSGDGSIFGCGSWNDRAGGYITSVLGHYQTFTQMAGIPYPY